MIAAESSEVVIWGLLVVALVALVGGFISRAIAKARGHTSTAVFFWVGFLFPVIGIIVAAVAPVSEIAHDPLPPSEWTRDRDKAVEQAAIREDTERRLEKLRELYRDGLITEEEHKNRRQQIIDEL